MTPKTTCALLLILLLAIPAQAEQAHLIRVIDGDSLLVELRGVRVQVRLLGLDAPENYQEWGEQATNFVREWTSHGLLELEYGPTRYDRYNRLLAWVWRNDGQMLNQDLLGHGLAISYLLNKKGKHYEQLTTSEALARETQTGFWLQGGLKKTPRQARKAHSSL